MTETTSIQNFMRERHAFAAVIRQPGLATFVAQAAIGSFCGSFIVLIARILLVYQSYNALLIFSLPFLTMLGLATGIVAGFLIWAASKEADGRLLGITRSLMGVLVTGLAWFALWYYWLKEEFSSDKLPWMLAVAIVSGLSIGLLTGSRLRLWRELVRGGETKTTLLKILAGLIGLVLRSLVVLLFLSTLVMTIASLQEYYLDPEPGVPETKYLVWTLLLFGHFATGVFILFARMRFWPLVLLTVISVSPVIASLWSIVVYPPDRDFIYGYLGAWAVFLLTRWRQTDIAFAYLNEELRYYLID